MEAVEHRNWQLALWRGFQRHCPRCSKAPLFAGYIKSRATCGHCALELHHQRADDAPPYFTIFIAGHIIVPLVLVVEKLWHPELLLQYALWLPATLLLVYWLMPRVKGATIGLQWALGMHGFGGPDNTRNVPHKP